MLPQGHRHEIEQDVKAYKAMLRKMKQQYYEERFDSIYLLDSGYVFHWKETPKGQTHRTKRDVIEWCRNLILVLQYRINLINIQSTSLGLYVTSEARQKNILLRKFTSELKSFKMS